MSAAVSIVEPAVLGADGCMHFSDLKHLAKSGKHYLHAVNSTFSPTPAMMLGTLVHFLVLGARPGSKRLVRYDGGTRQGNVWKEFAALNSDAEVLTAKEWSEGEVIAEAVKADPVARARLEGARFEVALRWEEDGVPCSTSGVDIVSNGALCDLKTTRSVEPEAWKRQAFRMYYAQQMAFYQRGARANGIDTSKGLYLLGVETDAPFDVVELELSEGMIAMADRMVTMWLERFKVFRDSNQWPGFAQSPVVFDVPAWMQEGEDDDA